MHSAVVCEDVFDSILCDVPGQVGNVQLVPWAPARSPDVPRTASSAIASTSPASASLPSPLRRIITAFTTTVTRAVKPARAITATLVITAVVSTLFCSAGVMATAFSAISVMVNTAVVAAAAVRRTLCLSVRTKVVSTRGTMFASRSVATVAALALATVIDSLESSRNL
eukprot:CAMPEP_0171121316 /NCGR_PEP_ID=MMETSP0766_2-20121228/102129_1 /TAXON_ID=439317 /ORGANISM="Gambierdiscus australes, Strain CAWD 149" /LENGTH=168 /DNA_ID=CAMNT_0011584093 /DNA_START=325 /DNA_END=832 /DNA_ORIENTATION=-